MATTAMHHPHPSMLNTEREPVGPFGSQGQSPPPPRERGTVRAIGRASSRMRFDTLLWSALGALGLGLLLFGVYNRRVRHDR